MKIETATTDSLPEVLALLEGQFGEHAIALPPGELAGALHVLLREPLRGSVLVARDGGAIGVAVLAYTWTLEHGGAVAWLDELFVIPARRQEGIGLALLRRAIQVAKGAGCRAIDLEVESDHARAEHLYAREGFRRLTRNRWALHLD